MFLSKLSKTGLVFSGVYGALFIYALWVAYTTCPDWFCTLLIQLSTIPWSLLFEPQFGGVYTLPRPQGVSLYIVHTFFACLNSYLFYQLGKLVGHLTLRIRNRLHSA